MASTVRLSLKAARGIAIATRWPGTEWAFEELRAAIARAERQSTVRRKLAKPKRQKRKAKQEETSALREAVFKRAGEKCELCLLHFSALELHHALGRGRSAQAASNCLALCRFCHEQVTNSRDGAASLRAQAEAFARLEHYDTARVLKWRADFVASRKALGVGGAP